MTIPTVLSAASAQAHPATLTALQVAVTVGAGGAAAVLLRGRARLAGRMAATSSLGARPAADAVQALAPARRADPAITCRPQLLTPPGTARARGEVDQWLARGELDLETYRELSRVFAEVEAATRD
ncbi:hypothetical protein V3N99_10015 [Dermatophilaceae bacterium Soc4.6]